MVQITGYQHKWTKKEERLLYDMLYNDNKTYQECADKLGRTYGSIQSKINDKGWMKVKRPDNIMWNDILDKKIISHRKSGMSNKDIANIMFGGKHYNGVINRITHLVNHKKISRRKKI